MLKVGDVLDFNLKISINESDDLETGYLEDYDREYYISYKKDNEEILFEDFEEKGGVVFFSIKSYLEAFIKNEFEEISDYEVFDINDKNFEDQTAKIRVKAIKY